MLIGIVGKTNTGKTTFFCAATLVDAEIENRPFVTIKPNQGTAFVKKKCPHLDLGKQCNPVNSKCINGIRLIPINLLDVAGLVPNAHEGRGLGIQFLNDLISADALIHVIDISGATDFEGKPVEKFSHNPSEDVKFLEKEIAYWIKSILTRNWGKISKQASMDVKGPFEVLAKQLSGMRIKEDEIKEVLKKNNFSLKPIEWSEEEILLFSEKIREKSKPILIAANKIDVEGSEKNLEKLKKEFPNHKIVPCSAESELALRKAQKAGLIEYVPGEKEFKLLKELPEKQRHALDFIKTHVLEKFGSTGIQQAINTTAFELLDLIAVYPVQDQHKWVSGQGNVLPDAYLLKRGSTALDLAFKIHSDFGNRFVSAIDCRSGKKIGKEEALKDGDVIKIMLK